MQDVDAIKALDRAVLFLEKPRKLKPEELVSFREMMKHFMEKDPDGPYWNVMRLLLGHIDVVEAENVELHAYEDRLGKHIAETSYAVGVDDTCTPTERVSAVVYRDLQRALADTQKIAEVQRTEIKRLVEEKVVVANDENSWTSTRDEPLPEDAEIDAAHPMRSGRHDLWAEAMRLVGAKRSKGSLVALVNWLLIRVAARRGIPSVAIPTFEKVWAEKKKEGYQYGEDALEQVRFGWEIAFDALGLARPKKSG